MPRLALAVLVTSIAGGVISPQETYGAIPLEKALAERRVEATIEGMGASSGEALRLTIRRRGTQELAVSLTPGTVFTPFPATDYQHMVGLSVRRERLGDGEFRECREIVLDNDKSHVYLLEAYCLDIDSSNPGDGLDFSVDWIDDDAGRLLLACDEAGIGVRVTQAVVWIERGNPASELLKERLPFVDEEIEVARHFVAGLYQSPQAVLDGEVRQVLSLAFSPDGESLVAGCDHPGDGSGVEESRLQIWDVSKRELTASHVIERGLIHSVAVSPDGATIATGCSNSSGGSLLIWRDGTPTEIENRRLGVSEVAFSPDGAMLAAAGASGDILLIDGKGRLAWTGLPRQPFEDPGPVNSLAFSADGKQLAAGGWGIRLWNPQSGRATRTLDARGEANMEVDAVVFAPDGSLLAGGSRDGVIRLWNQKRREVEREMRGHGDLITRVAFSPDGEFLWSAGGDGRVCVWDLSSGKRVGRLRRHATSVQALAIGPHGKLVATSDSGGKVALWELDKLDLR